MHTAPQRTLDCGLGLGGLHWADLVHDKHKQLRYQFVSWVCPRKLMTYFICSQSVLTLCEELLGFVRILRLCEGLRCNEKLGLGDCMRTIIMVSLISRYFQVVKVTKRKVSISRQLSRSPNLRCQCLTSYQGHQT